MKRPATPNLDLTGANYQDQLDAYVKSLSNAFFLQDSFSPDKLRNLTINAGLRLELQKIYGTDGSAFLSTDNLSPRLSAVYDPFNDGKSKLSVAYGRFYEAVPLDVAARYFGGENSVQQFGFLAQCPGNLQNGYNWTGAGEYAKCGAPARNHRAALQRRIPPSRTSRASTTTRSSPRPSARSWTT